MEMEEKKIDGIDIYNGKVIHVVKDNVLCPNGNISIREIVKHNGGAAILCLNDKEEVLLEKQYRYAYNEIIYEIPAGKLELNENPYDAALRELEEETGKKAESLKKLGEIYPTCGYSSEVIHIFLALNTKKTNTKFDDDEVIVSKYIPLKEVKDMIKKGIIKDAKTIAAIYYYELLKEN